VLQRIVQIGNESVTLSRADDSICWFSDEQNQFESEKHYARQREQAFAGLRRHVSAIGSTGDFNPPQQSPERALWSAILERAILDVQGNVILTLHEDPVTIRAEAQAWFESESEESGSFIFCCEVLDVSPAVVLEKIKIVGQETADQSVCQSEWNCLTAADLRNRAGRNVAHGRCDSRRQTWRSGRHAADEITETIPVVFIWVIGFFGQVAAHIA
jgi:hypothetical protein